MRLTTLSLCLVLLIPAAGWAQDQHIASVDVGDKTYHVHTEISPDGRTSTSRIHEVTVPALGEIITAFKELRQEKIAKNQRNAHLKAVSPEAWQKRQAQQLRAEQDSALRIARVRPRKQ